MTSYRVYPGTGSSFPFYSPPLPANRFARPFSRTRNHNFHLSSFCKYLRIAEVPSKVSSTSLITPPREPSKPSYANTSLQAALKHVHPHVFEISTIRESIIHASRLLNLLWREKKRIHTWWEEQKRRNNASVGTRIAGRIRTLRK